jgi:hypothetical protein
MNGLPYRKSLKTISLLVVEIALLKLIAGCNRAPEEHNLFSTPVTDEAQATHITAPDTAEPSQTVPSEAASINEANVMSVPRFGIFEQAFEHAGNYANPYTQATAVAMFTSPNGNRYSIPLFWNGDRQWKVRFSPNLEGKWNWSIRSNDAGLDGQTGSFTTIASTAKGGIQIWQDFPYHLQHQDGTPFWLFGETSWRILGSDPQEELDRNSFEQYIERRASQGFNFIHTNVLLPGQNEGGSAFLSLRNEQLDPGYWQEVDGRIEYMNQRDMAVMLFLAWADLETGWRRRLPWRTPQLDWRSFPNQAARLRYAQYLAARYSAYNVGFSVAGEWDEFGDRAMHQEIARTVQETDPHDRPITIHPGAVGSVAEFAREPWMTFGDYQQVYENLHEHILKTRVNEKPVINSEYAYYLRDQSGDGQVDKPNSSTLEEIRHASWDIAMAGGYFITGWGSTYFGGGRNPGTFAPADPRNADWEQNAQHIREFFTAIDWWTLEPSSDLISGSGTRYALADVGRQYVIYTRDTNDRITLTLADANQSYIVKRFDPRTGTYTELADHMNAAVASIHPPDRQDWVFLLERKVENEEQGI